MYVNLLGLFNKCLFKNAYLVMQDKNHNTNKEQMLKSAHAKANFFLNSTILDFLKIFLQGVYRKKKAVL